MLILKMSFKCHLPYIFLLGWDLSPTNKKKLSIALQKLFNITTSDNVQMEFWHNA